MIKHKLLLIFVLIILFLATIIAHHSPDFNRIFNSNELRTMNNLNFIDYSENNKQLFNINKNFHI